MSRANGNGLAHRYHLLEPQERFRAALEAAARDDDDERERLVDTCTKRPCRVTDPAFSDRCDASHALAVAVALDLAPRMAQLRLLEGTAELVGDALTLGRGLEAGDEPPLVKAFSLAASELRSEAAAIFGAFGAVCRAELRLEPETVLRAQLGGQIVDWLGLAQLDGVKPDRAVLASTRRFLADQWRTRTGRE